MFKKCSNFHWCLLRGFNFIETVYELFDNPSYSNKNYCKNYDNLKIWLQQGYFLFFFFVGRPLIIRSFKFLYICFILLIHCLDSWKCNNFTLFMQYLVVRGSSSVFLNEWRSLHSIVWQQMVQIRVFLMIYDMKATADVKQIYTSISRFLDEFTKLYSLSYIKTYRPINYISSHLWMLWISIKNFFDIYVIVWILCL